MGYRMEEDHLSWTELKNEIVKKPTLTASFRIPYTDRTKNVWFESQTKKYLHEKRETRVGMSSRHADSLYKIRTEGDLILMRKLHARWCLRNKSMKQLFPKSHPKAPTKNPIKRNNK